MRRRCSYPFLVLLACVSSTCSRLPNAPIPAAKQVGFQRGMSLACWSAACLDQPGLQTNIRELAATGSRWISLIVTGYQSTSRSTQILYPTSRGPDDAALRSAIAAVQASGLRITLKPHVDLLDGTWRGKISPPDVRKWFESYTGFILHFAAIAEQTGVDQFVVGTELVNLSPQREAWLALIARVRAVYSGRILYAASWNEFEMVPFWRAVDYAGINAYFPLTSVNDPSLVDLLAGWEFWRVRLDRWQKHLDKEVIFTEIGYTSRDGTNRNPFEFRSAAPLDVQEQADCYQAALRYFARISYLRGVYWWYWPLDQTVGSHAGDYPPVGKPAAEVLRRAWTETSE